MELNFFLNIRFKIKKRISRFFIYYNRLFFSILGVKYGKRLSVFNRIYIRMYEGAKFIIGDNVIFSSGSGINPLCRNIRGQIFITQNAEIIIGNNSGLSSTALWAKESIRIGDNVNIGGDCIIMDTDAHSLDWRIRGGTLIGIDNKIIKDYDSAKSAPIIIEDNVLIGTRCIILKGVTIGARSIIGAGSVVTKSIPPNCIAGGNPCKVIRQI